MLIEMVRNASIAAREAQITPRPQGRRGGQIDILGPAQAVAVQQQLEQDGSKAKIATCAFTSDLTRCCKAARSPSAQQPCLQRYLAVDGIWLYYRNDNVLGHNVLGAQQPIPAGPVVVNRP
jgi:hypothetical protein